MGSDMYSSRDLLDAMRDTHRGTLRRQSHIAPMINRLCECGDIATYRKIDDQGGDHGYTCESCGIEWVREMRAHANRRQFPLLHDYRKRAPNLRQSIPWEMIAPHERRVRLNHGQSLERLAERGGLDPGEACDVLLGRSYNTTPGDQADALLEELVAAWEERQVSHDKPQ